MPLALIIGDSQKYDAPANVSMSGETGYTNTSLVQNITIQYLGQKSGDPNTLSSPFTVELLNANNDNQSVYFDLVSVGGVPMNLAVGASFTITIRPKPGLAPGTYTARLFSILFLSPSPSP